MIKIINVITDTNIGGAGKTLLTFLRNFDRTEFDISVALPKESALIPEIEGLGIQYFEVEGIADISFNFPAIKTLQTLFEQQQPAIVHTHASLSARIAARRYKKCGVIHTRHSVFEQSNSKKRFPLKNILGAVNNYLSDIIIAVSPAAKTNMVETGTDPGKVQVIYNGVDPVEPLTDDEKSLEMARLGCAPDDFICAIAARVEKFKGHSYILKAAELFKLNNSNVRIIIAGTGSEVESLKLTAVKMGLDNCIFTGFVQDIRKIEGIMNLQINATYGAEATSLSLLEGMSLGIPAVATDSGGNPFVVQDGVTGIIVPQKNYTAIYEAVMSLINNKELYEKMKIKSKERFNEAFTSEIMTESIQNVYRKLYEDKVWKIKTVSEPEEETKADPETYIETEAEIKAESEVDE